MLLLKSGLSLCVMLISAAAVAETVVPTRMIRAQAIIAPGDVKLHPGAVEGAIGNPDLVIGQEARIVLYPGRPVRPGDVGPPAIVQRNQIVAVEFRRDGLVIRTDGRALDRAGAGERLRVMNLTSRTAVSGLVLPDGTVSVSSQ